MAAFREAESRGLDLDRAVPALVQGRGVRSADDIAAVIHGRVAKWLESAGGRLQADRIVGLFPPAGGVTDSDIEQALEDRRLLIEHRARAVAVLAIERHLPWVMRLGTPSAYLASREAWPLRLDTVAAYRDLWQIRGRAGVGELEPRSRAQSAQREAAECAAQAALRRQNNLHAQSPRTPEAAHPVSAEAAEV